MKKNHLFIAIVIFSLFAGACGKLKGDFSLRRYSDEVYKKTSAPFECAVSEELQWAYVFTEVKKRHDIAVIIQKKEIGWIESRSWSDYISMEKPALHGTIKNYKPGEYQILILQTDDENILLDRLGFFVYEKVDAGS